MYLQIYLNKIGKVLVYRNLTNVRFYQNLNKIAVKVDYGSEYGNN